MHKPPIDDLQDGWRNKQWKYYYYP